MNVLSTLRDRATSLISPSPFQDVVDQATSEFLLTPDWEKNIAIVDQVNLKPDNAKEVVRAIRRRTSHSNPKVQSLALNLIETCMKNCGTLFASELAQNKDLLQDILRIATKEAHGAGEHEAQQKSLQLILTWNHACRGRIVLHPLADLHNQAAQRGARFDSVTVLEDVQIEDSRAANTTPQQRPSQAASAPAGALRGAGGAPRPPRKQGRRAHFDPSLGIDQPVADAEPLTEVRLQQLLDEAHTCVGLLTEMAQAHNGNPAALATDELCQQVVSQARAVQQMVVRAIENGAPAGAEAGFDVLLDLNDALLLCLEQCSGEAPVAAPAGGPVVQPGRANAGAPAKPPAASLDDILGLGTTTPAPAAPAKPAPQAPPKDEFDDIFGQPAPSTVDDFFTQRTTANQPPVVQPPRPAPAVPKPAPAPAATPPQHDEDDFFASRVSGGVAVPTPVQAPVDEFDSFAASRIALATPAPPAQPASPVQPPVVPASSPAPAPAPVPVPAPAPAQTTVEDDEFEEFAASRVAPAATTTTATVTATAAPEDEFEEFAASRATTAVPATAPSLAPVDEFEAFAASRLASHGAS
eukprot:TRINITY_DN54390_c0_g1_i1.p2 TRINITY_DN54390_c0_g1~~TRINITY_DN54390_c0_g1_i1.p2  ORF type:complete len:582 (-),score=77.70 TRINITY_DN54390_c0_g1_i1:97-1842(-)